MARDGDFCKNSDAKIGTETYLGLKYQTYTRKLFCKKGEQFNHFLYAKSIKKIVKLLTFFTKLSISIR